MLRNTHNRIRSSLEALEARDTPAGTVTATFTAGRLTITGDAADNTLLLRTDWDDCLIISGNASGTVVRLNGGPAGDEVKLPTPLTGGVAINLGDGADNLTIDAADVPGSLTINGGNGAPGGPAGNTINLSGGVLIGGNLTITNLAGLDTTQLSGLVNLGGNMTIRNGAGGSLVSGDDTTDLHVGGVLSVFGGAGYDKVDVGAAVNVVVGSLVFNSGTDRDGSHFRVHPLGDLSVAGAVRVTNGPGADNTEFGGRSLTIGGALTVRNGNGDSDTVVTAEQLLFVGGPTRVTSGDGKDLVYIGPGREIGDPLPAADIGSVTVNNGAGGSETAIVATRLTVRGSVNISAWDGTDEVGVASESDSGSISGNVWIDIGPGEPPPDDETAAPEQLVGVAAANDRVLTIGGSLGIWTDDSEAPTMIALGNVNVRSWTDILTGDGEDQVMVTHSTFGGTFDLETAGANDLVNLEANRGATYFRGPVWCSTGAGNDYVLLAGDPDLEGFAVFAAATYWDGGSGTDFLLGRNINAIFYGPDPEMWAIEAQV
jgi:hypothetical protein